MTLRTLVLTLIGGTLSACLWGQSTDYPLNFDKSQRITHASRRLQHIDVTTSDGTQRLQGLSTDKAFSDLTLQRIYAQAGDKVKVSFGFAGTWMNGYVYIDLGQDGRFTPIIENNRPTASSDLVAYSNLKSHNSKGEKLKNPNTLHIPEFTLPANLAPGIYRLRFKVDWDSADPAGALSPDNNSVGGRNGIIANGGAIADAVLCVHGKHTRLDLGEHATHFADATGKALPGQVPFGRALTCRINPPAGQRLDYLRVRHGVGLTQAPLVHSTPQWVESLVPGYLVREDSCTIPADLMANEVMLIPAFVPATTSTTSTPYALNFDPTLTRATTATTHLTRLTLTPTNGTPHTWDFATTGKQIYQDFTRALDKEVFVQPGTSLQVQPTLKGTAALHAYFYLDLNQDGRFTTSLDEYGSPTISSELMELSQYNGRDTDENALDVNQQHVTLNPIYIPLLLPEGVYRARLVLAHNSIDPAGRYAADDAHSIERDGGQVVDFLINVHGNLTPLTLVTAHGNVYTADDALPLTLTPQTSLTLRAVPVAEGYELDEYTLRSGHHLDGPQYVNGNRQWEEVRLTKTNDYRLQPRQTYGQLRITARFSPTSQAKYLPLMVEEFDGNDGDRPNPNLWQTPTRYPSVTWARWISDAPEAAFIENNELVCRALPTPQSEKDKGETAPMITGAVKSQGLFDFQYGKVEGRIFTRAHRGNFPAFWMMPTPKEGDKPWPWSGEIDIWEQIDAKNASIHTVHTNWTYNLKKTNDPKNTHTQGNMDMGRYHTYGIEWSPTEIKWFVDGRLVHTYAKRTSAEALAQGQWPFDRKFYLILNQSVGNGSWAAAADTSHTYETRFDWVRVYQTKAQNPQVGIADAPIAEGGTQLDTHYYDLSGRRVTNPTKGIYIYQGKKVFR